MRITLKIALSFVLLAATLPSAGCRAPWSSESRFGKFFSLDSAWPWGDDGPEEGIPTRLVGTWVDTVLNQAGRPSQRGFGGRLIFYGRDGDKPIKVDGQLVVYAFDETNREPTDNRPTRRYVFPADQVALRMSISELGPSYSFWLPWDEVGGPQTEVSLIARFEPKGGAVVVGEQTRHILPGSLTAPDVVAKNEPPRLPEGVPSRPARPQLPSSAPAAAGNESVQQASYQPPATEQQRRMTTTSISLPEHFGRRIGTVTSPTPVTASAANASGVGTAAPVPAQSQIPTTRFSPATPTYQPLSAGLPPMPQSPFAGRAIYGAPLTPTSTMPTQSPAYAPTPQTQTPTQTPTGTPDARWATAVSYSPAAGAAAPATPALPPSTGFPPQPLPAPTTPAVR